MSTKPYHCLLDSEEVFEVSYQECLNYQSNSEENIKVLPKEDTDVFELQDLPLDYNYED